MTNIHTYLPWSLVTGNACLLLCEKCPCCVSKMEDGGVTAERGARNLLFAVPVRTPTKGILLSTFQVVSDSNKSTSPLV